MFKKISILAMVTLCICSASPIHSDTYIDSTGIAFTYNRDIPYRMVARVTTHKEFTNIYLDDGSVWRAEDYSSGAEACKWLINDPVIIYPSKNTFSKEKYSLYNERLKKFAHVDISCSSASNDTTYLSLTHIDFSTNVITLENGFSQQLSFEITTSDLYRLSSWEIDDCVILGWNKDMWPGNDLYYPYILINTNLNEYIKAEYIEYLY